MYEAQNVDLTSVDVCVESKSNNETDVVSSVMAEICQKYLNDYH